MAIVLLKPNYPPYVCIVCGLGNRDSRKWFVDLQLAIDNYFNPVNDGAVYMCNECWEGLVREVSQKAYAMMKEEEPWEASLNVSYAAEGELLQSRPLTSNTEAYNQGAGDNTVTPVGNQQAQPVGILEFVGEPTQEEIEAEDNPVGNQEQETDGPGISSEGSGELNFAITGDDTNTETTDSELDTDTTTDTEPVREFREFFGKPV